MTTASVVPAGLAVGTWTIDTSHSEVAFSIRHMGLFKVRGSFAAFQGSITIADDIAKSSATVEVDMASVDTRDQNRDAHLRSPDFFEVEKFPKMVFEGNAVRIDGDEVVLVGDLTVKDIKRPFELTVESNGVLADPMGNQRAGFVARGELRRSDFGITFNIPMGESGVVIGDKVDVQIEVQVVLAEDSPRS
jgi:polyisoprenoid-binding protein YceI